MDQQIISLLAEIRDILQQTKERDDKWLDEVRQRDEESLKFRKHQEAKYDKWHKEDLARIKRNEEIAQRNLEKAYWIGLNAERPEEELPAEAIKEATNNAATC